MTSAIEQISWPKSGRYFLKLHSLVPKFLHFDSPINESWWKDNMTYCTLEIKTCFSFRSTKCAYMDGSCLASPRWVSLLVAEVYYPDTTFPNPSSPQSNRSPVRGSSPPQVKSENLSIEIRTLLKLMFLKGYENQYFSNRQGASSSEKCDGHDDMGCYQVIRR